MEWLALQWEFLTMSPFMTAVFLYLAVTTSYWLYTFGSYDRYPAEPTWWPMLGVVVFMMAVVLLPIAILLRLALVIFAFGPNEPRPQWYETFPPLQKSPEQKTAERPVSHCRRCLGSDPDCYICSIDQTAGERFPER